jgi:hypothetical protein
VFYRLKNRLERTQYEVRCKKVYSAPPLERHDGHLRIVSMVSHADLTMYFVAVQSLYRQINEGSIVVINDGSLNQDDLRLLTRHLGPLEVVNVHEVETGVCPKGGTWERLLKIVEFTRDSYVIQMDSDTLTRGAIDEVVECYRGNRSFTLGSHTGQEFAPLSEAQDRIPAGPGKHVQVLAERVLPSLDGAKTLRYVRGSSGFAGFARGAFSRAQVERFSFVMSTLLGHQKWNEWGTEQVTSNYVIANAPDAVVLPYPKYRCFFRDVDPTSAVFLHFIGVHRFARGVYARESETVIRSLLHGKE